MVVMRDGGGGGTSSSTVSLAGLLGAITGAVTGTGGSELFIDAATVANIRTKLEAAREELVQAQGEMKTMSPSGVGGSPVAASLVQHASLADTKLRETIDAINVGLARYDEAMLVSLSAVEAADEQAAADAAAGETAIAEATGPAGSGVSG